MGVSLGIFQLVASSGVEEEQRKKKKTIPGKGEKESESASAEGSWNFAKECADILRKKPTHSD